MQSSSHKLDQKLYQTQPFSRPSIKRPALGAKVDWRFSTEDARIKLTRLYPSVEE